MTASARSLIQRWHERIGWPLWLLLLLVVPWTSSRYVVKLIGRTPVSPLALFPLVALAVFWLLPELAKGRKIPAVAWPLFGLVLAALISVTAAQFLPLEPYKGQTPLRREARGLITLGIGLAFYLVAALQVKDEGRLRTSLRVLYIGALLTLLWGTVQAYFVLDGRRGLPDWFTHLHRQFVIRQPFEDRVTGLAFEPSWFADQMVLLYLPLWLSSVLNRHSVFSPRRTWLSVELGLLIWAIALFLLSFSRGGYLTFFTIVAVLVLLSAWRASDSLRRRVGRRMGELPKWKAAGIRAVIVTFALGFLLLLFLAVAVWVSERDRRMTSLRVLPSQLGEIQREHPGEVIYALADRLGFAERAVFWEAGYRPFELSPITGVGLGNAGFFFPRVAPAYGYGLTEIRILLDPANPNFPNPKNLWIRLLSETGILGFAFYVVWLVLLFLGGLAVMRSQRSMDRVLGFAGCLAVGALLLEGFSLDTFALPQMWLVTGFLSSEIGRLAARSGSENFEIGTLDADSS